MREEKTRTVVTEGAPRALGASRGQTLSLLWWEARLRLALLGLSLLSAKQEVPVRLRPFRV